MGAHATDSAATGTPHVNLLDALIVLAAIGAAILGARSGFVVQIGVMIGAITGMFVGALMSRLVARLATDPIWRAVLVLATVALVAAVLANAGGYAGRRLSVVLGRVHLRGVDETLGAIVAVVGTLLAAWLLAASLASLPQAGIGPLIQRSLIIEQLDGALPPVPEVTAQLGRLIDPLGLPRVFVGIEQRPAAPVAGPTSEQIQAAAAAASASMVRIRGAGCGGVLSGSGFIVGPGLVMTNAHVVAGIVAPQVEQGTATLDAVPLVFDPAVDLAVLRVDGLDAPALPIAAKSAERGDAGAILGFPAGYGFTVAGAAVLDRYDALGRDIYDQSIVSRPILELQATVLPGDSGGPFVLADGQVYGVVFARSVSHPDVGYAIGADAAAAHLAEAASTAQPVGTGSCAAD